MAVPDAGIPGIAEGPRNHTVDVEEGQLPGQLQDGELLLQAEEGDVLRTRKGIPRLCGIPEGDRRIHTLVQQREDSREVRLCSCGTQEHCPYPYVVL